MFSNKENVNILTALLVKHGVKHVVVCPGSRNAPIVHNLHELETRGILKCYPVTDERSAGFYAIGLAQGTEEMVAVCVTSGSALLNLAPAAAEAKYQKIPIVIISADRPAAWIDQLDGQTLPQPNALGSFALKCVNLPEVHTDEERRHCNRLVNEALLECKHNGGAPVHINVPISEPLFVFDTEELPNERKIERHKVIGAECPKELAEDLEKASKPLLIIGQTKKSEELLNVFNELKKLFVVVQEPLSGRAMPMDEALKHIGDDSKYMPDLIIYAGETIVSKPIKQFLRKAETATQWRISEKGNVEDCFGHLTNIAEGNVTKILKGLLNSNVKANEQASEYKLLWDKAIEKAQKSTDEYESFFGARLAVKTFEKMIGQMRGYEGCAVHYANSTAIRLACIYADHYVYCNRGVNGIEGSLSTAAGFSLATDKRVFCIIGDLSFFYDQNALWNTRLRGNLRILLLNDGGGAIFKKLPGLEQSSARDTYIAARHNTTAQGICMENNIEYLCANNAKEMETAMGQLLYDNDTQRPIILEIIIN